MSPIVADLYILCCIFLIAFGVYVYRQDPLGRANRLFAWLSLALLGWVGTLFAFSLIVSPDPLLIVGRLNFAAMAVVVPLAYLFTRTIAGRSLRRLRYLWIETWLMVLTTVVSPWIDRVETISSNGTHITTYGILFPIYVIHILTYVGAALFVAFDSRARRVPEQKVQLTAIGIGILATTAIALTTNLVLPYWFGDFALINVGTISTILFLGAAGYAAFAYHLFDVHVFVRATVVYAGFISLALELYNIALHFLGSLIPLADRNARNFAATSLVIVFSAFTEAPIRAWLNKMIGRVRSKHISNGHTTKS